MSPERVAVHRARQEDKRSRMNRTMTDRQADLWLLFAFFSWGVACAVPPLGLLLQFLGVGALVFACNVKAIPAFLLLVLDRGSLVGNDGFMAMRLGVTISPRSFLVILMFMVTVWNLLKNRYDRGASLFAWLLWLPCLVPALWMSMEARSEGLSGIWSYPAMDFLIPSLYYWGLLASRTYETGKAYLLTRLVAVLFILACLMAARVVFFFSFSDYPLMFCTAVYYLRARDWRTRRGKLWAYLLFFVVSFLLVFGRAIMLKDDGQAVNAGDEYGSTFSRMAIVAVALFFAFTIRRRSQRVFLRWIPLLMVIVNVAFTVFVLSTQQGARHIETQWQESFDTFGERLKYKLWGDRATVWQMGWDEMRTPPYFIRDLRQFYSFNARRGDMGLKLLPHHQFITLLARDGYWLGGVLSIFIVWVWVRAMKGLSRQLDDTIQAVVLIPAGLAVFFIVGITGQSVVSSELWANGLACLIFPGIVYGSWLERRRQARGRSQGWTGYGPPPVQERPLLAFNGGQRR